MTIMGNGGSVNQQARYRNEADTRADFIDPVLRDCDWGQIPQSIIRREYAITQGRILVGGKRAKPLLADYVLIYKGRRLAVVEAKKETLSYTDGINQALEYADMLQCRITYATNGHEIYQIDMFTGEQKLVDRFMTPDELWQLTFESGALQLNQTTHALCMATSVHLPVLYREMNPLWREQFATVPFESKGDWQPRYYQENAINNALDAIASNHSRILLTLATGTGKTCIAFQIAWKLFQTRWNLKNRDVETIEALESTKRRPRILFLADRNILANQAFNDFSAFGEDAIVRIEPSEIKKAGRVPKNASVFFTIFQTFMSGGKTEKELDLLEEQALLEDQDEWQLDDTSSNIHDLTTQNQIQPKTKATPYFGEYPQDFFDLIIIDECHRGGARDESSWREILEYFSSAVQIGLTATPKREINTDTYAYFGDPVYTYTLKQGINDGFLTPFKVMPIVGTMDEYIYTPGDGIVVSGNPEPGKLYEEKDFNRIITIAAREEQRTQYWMDLINPKEKTIVFCATQEHAGRVATYINQYAVKKGWTRNPQYCVRVTANDGKRGETFLEQFSDNEKTIPTILTTSRKLSTGVDARNVRNVVLMRPCNNMIEFKQIIGRGTRMYEGKEFFTIYDFVKAHHNFADPDWDGEPIPPQDPCLICSNVPCSCSIIPCSNCGFSPCACPPAPCAKCGTSPCCCPAPKCKKCGQSLCICQPNLCPDCGYDPCVCIPNNKIEITLSDGKVRQIKHIHSLMYFNPDDGKPMTAKEFVERLYNDLPTFFQDEDQLREIWSAPDTREKLLNDLEGAGYDEEKLEGMKALIDAQDSDVYDVLRFVAYALDTQTRIERVANAKPNITKAFSDDKQQEFIDFILSKYIEDGVSELAISKMGDLIKLKYNTIDDALEQLGSIPEIRQTFLGFQQFLYA